MKTTKFKQIDKDTIDKLYGHTNKTLKQGYEAGLHKDGVNVTIVTRCCNCGQYERANFTRNFIRKLFNF